MDPWSENSETSSKKQLPPATPTEPSNIKQSTFSNVLSMISTTSSASPSSPDPWKMNISTTLWSTNILPSFQTDPSNPASPTTLDVKQNTNNLDWFDSNDHVDIELANEKGGFIVKHVLFTLKSTVFPGNTVLRRYSDFHWLNDLLLKRYPTRLIPSLPPKKVNVDLQFLEQRKRGLIRFMNFISNHPVLKKDSTFITFISMQSEEFNILRKSNQEQAEEIVSSVSELVSVPSDFSSKLYIFEHKIQSIIDYYTELAAYLEIIVRRQDANSLGMIEFGKRLERLSEYNDCLETCNNCSGLNMGYMEIQTSFEKASNSVFENAKGNFMGLVEDLKVFRDLLISMQQMLARRHVNIQDTEKRLVLNQSKLAIATPDHDKIKFLILQDQNVVEFYNKRIRFIEYSVYCEFLMYHSKKAKIIKSFEGLVNNELKHANEMRGIWTVLKECVLIVK